MCVCVCVCGGGGYTQPSSTVSSERNTFCQHTLNAKHIYNDSLLTAVNFHSCGQCVVSRGRGWCWGRGEGGGRGGVG